MSFSRVDISKIPNTSRKLFMMAFCLAGLSPEEKQTVDIGELYRTEVGSKLTEDIYQELKRSVKKETDISKLTKTINNGLIRFARSLTNHEITQFYIKFAEQEKKDLNISGVLEVAFGHQEIAQTVLVEKALKDKSQKAWDNIIRLCKDKRSFSEKLNLNPRRAVALTIIFIFLIYSIYKLIKKCQRDSQNCLSFSGETGSLGEVGVRILMIMLAAPWCRFRPNFSDPQAKIDFAQMGGFVKTAIDQYMLEHFRGEYRGDANLKVTPAATFNFPDEEGASLVVKRKNLGLSTETEEKKSINTSVKEPIVVEKDELIYFPVHYTHLRNVFFKYKRSQLREMLGAKIKNEATINMLLGKIMTQGFNGRVLPTNSKQCGFVQLNDAEKAKFPNGIKLRTLADFQFELERRSATSDERDLGIEEALSPRGGKFHKV